MKKIASKKLSFKRISTSRLSGAAGGTWGPTNDTCPSVYNCEQYEGAGSGSGDYGDEPALESTDNPESGIPNECLECRERKNAGGTLTGG